MGEGRRRYYKDFSLEDEYKDFSLGEGVRHLKIGLCTQALCMCIHTYA